MSRAPVLERSCRFDSVHGDEDYREQTPAEEAAQEARIARKAEELVCSGQWWDEKLCEVNALDRALPDLLARMMANTDSACSGDQIGRDALTTVASQIQRVARRMARDEVERSEL